MILIVHHCLHLGYHYKEENKIGSKFARHGAKKRSRPGHPECTDTFGKVHGRSSTWKEYIDNTISLSVDFYHKISVSVYPPGIDRSLTGAPSLQDIARIVRHSVPVQIFPSLFFIIIFILIMIKINIMLQIIIVGCCQVLTSH